MGRRTRAEEIGIVAQLEKLELPDIALAKDEKDVIAYIGAVSGALAKGVISPSWAKELLQGAAAVLRAIISVKRSQELERWEELERAMKEREARLAQRGERSRQHRENEPTKEPVPKAVLDQALAARRRPQAKTPTPPAPKKKRKR